MLFLTKGKYTSYTGRFWTGCSKCIWIQMLLLLHYVRVIELFHPNQVSQPKEIKSRFAPVLLCLILIPVNQHLFSHRKKKKKKSKPWNTRMVIRKQLSGRGVKQTALHNKEIKMNLGEGLYSRKIYRHILSECLFEERTMRSAVLFCFSSFSHQYGKSHRHKTAFL